MRIMVLSTSTSVADYAYEVYGYLNQTNNDEIGYDLSDRKITEKMTDCAREMVGAIAVVDEKAKKDRSVSLRLLGYENALSFSLIDGLHVLSVLNKNPLTKN